MTPWLALGLCLFAFSGSAYSLEKIKLTFPNQLKADYWQVTGENSGLKKSSLVRQLTEGKKRWSKDRFLGCFDALVSVRSSNPFLESAIRTQQLVCLNQGARSSAKKARSRLFRQFSGIKKLERLLYLNPVASKLRKEYAEFIVLTIEASAQSRGSRVWTALDEFNRFSGWFGASQKNRVFRALGAYHFRRQSWRQSLNYYEKVLRSDSDKVVLAKVESLRKSLGLKTTVSQTKESVPAVTLVSSTQDIAEEKWVNRIEASLSRSDLVGAAQDAIQLIQEYPAGVRADWAESRVKDIYLKINGQKSSNYKSVRERVVKFMLKADGLRLLRWAELAFQREVFEDSFELAEEAASQLVRFPQGLSAAMVAGRASQLLGEHKRAITFFQKVTQKGSGQPLSFEAQFWMGLSYFHLKNFGRASASFERLLASPQSADYEYRALYWYWQALRETQSDRAAEYAQRLMDRFPLTYYSLKTQILLSEEGFQIGGPDKKALRVNKSFSKSEAQAYRAFQFLLESGWLAEAQLMLRVLTGFDSKDEKLILAGYFAKTFDVYRASSLVDEVWSGEKNQVRTDIVRAIYPTHYLKELEALQKKYPSVPPSLALALIRQESAFQVHAKSSAGARGLMQLIPSTAKELAPEIGLKKFKSQDLFEWRTNLRIGVRYLDRLIRRFDGHWGLALAAYNAGIGNVQGLPKSPNKTEAQGTSSHWDRDSDLWAETLPWSETTYYIRALLRNYLVYEVLAGRNPKSLVTSKKAARK